MMNLRNHVRQLQLENNWSDRHLLNLLLHCLVDTGMEDAAIDALREFGRIPPDPSEIEFSLNTPIGPGSTPEYKQH
jgi:hypothetical protein